MAEAAALSLATSITQGLNLSSVTFVSDSQLLVHFINDPRAQDPSDRRAKPFTQAIRNFMDHQQGSIFKINRSMNTTADVLARQAYRATRSHDSNPLSHVCSHAEHLVQCPLMEALIDVHLQSVRLLAASCC